VADEELKSAGAAIRSVACSSDLLVTSSSMPVVKVWQVAEAAVKEKQRLSLVENHGAVGSSCVEVSGADGQQVAVCYDDGGIGLWDLRSGHRSGELAASILTAWKVKFLPGGRRLVSGGPSGSLCFWDTRMGGRLESEVGAGRSSLSRLKGEDASDPVKRRRTETKVQGGGEDPEAGGLDGGKLASPIFSLAISPDGSLLGCGRGSGAISVMRLESQEWAQDVKAHSLSSEKSAAAVRALTFDSASRLMLSGGDDHHVCLFDAAIWARRRSNAEARRCSQLERFSAHKGWVTSASACPDPAARVIVTTGWDHTVKLWDYTTHALLQTYKEHTDSVFASAFAPRDGRFFVTAGVDAHLAMYVAKHETSVGPDTTWAKDEASMVKVKEMAA
jgi:WD40 repeat protein